MADKNKGILSRIGKRFLSNNHLPEPPQPKNKTDRLQSGVSPAKRQLHVEQENVLRYFARQDAQVRAIAQKLVSRNQFTDKGREKQSSIPKQELNVVTGTLMNNIRNIRAIKRNLPEVETIQEILVSSILSPHDLVNEELVWTVGGTLPNDLSSALMTIVKDHFVSDYRINDKLSKMLGNALFDRGSHILAIFPESAIDDIIHSRTGASIESIHQTLATTIDTKTNAFKGSGYLGRGYLTKQKEKKTAQEKPRFALENYYTPSLAKPVSNTVEQDIIPGLLRVIDNRDIIKAPLIKRMVSETLIRRQEEVYSAEAVIFNPATDLDEVRKTSAVNELYGEVKVKSYDSVAVINDRDRTSRKSIGHPMVLDLPHECCMPVFTPGNPEDHIGYLILLDQLGNPVTFASERGNLENAQANWSSAKSGQSTQVNGTTTIITQTLNDLSNAMGKPDTRINEMTYDQLAKFYTEIVEKDLVMRFTDGVYGDHIQISRPEEIYQIMLARALAGSLTQILYIPASLVTYIAFYYNDIGIGESLITKAETIAALRIATMYANNVAVVKNAVGTRQIKVNMDDDEEAPDELIAKIVNRYLETNSMTTLFHSFDPAKIEQALMRSGIELIVEGNEGFESTSVEVEYKQGDRPMIDSDYEERQRKDFASALQVPSTMLEDSENADFAAEIFTKNALYRKRNRVRAVRFNECMRDFVEKYVLHDGTLIAEMSKVIRRHANNLSDDLLEEMREQKSTVPCIQAFLRDLEVGIPLSELDANEISADVWKREKERIENYVEVLFSDSTMKYLIGEETEPEKFKEVRENIVDIVKSYFLMKWIRDNNAFPEYDELMLDTEEQRENVLTQIYSTMDTVSRAFGGVLDRIYQRANPQEGEGEGGNDDTASTDTASSDDTGGTDDDSFGGDDDSTDDTADDADSDTDDDESDDEPSDEEDDPLADMDDADGGDDTADDDTDDE